MKGVILIGHGVAPSDCPRGLVTELKALEAARRASGGKPASREEELDRRIRKWPRTPKTDPYQAGIEALAAQLRPLLNGAGVGVAYNEFCAPSLGEAVEQMAAAGVRQIVVVSSMLTPGGVHSEKDIPEDLEKLRATYPGITIHYAWPFDTARISRLLAEHLDPFL